MKENVYKGIEHHVHLEEQHRWSLLAYSFPSLGLWTSFMVSDRYDFSPVEQALDQLESDSLPLPKQCHYCTVDPPGLTGWCWAVGLTGDFLLGSW